MWSETNFKFVKAISAGGGNILIISLKRKKGMPMGNPHTIKTIAAFMCISGQEIANLL